jgi:hypothetical protein
MLAIFLFHIFKMAFPYPKERTEENVYLSMTLQPFAGPRPLFSFLIFYAVSRTPWTGDQPVAKPLPAHTEQHKQNKRTQTSMAPVGLEPMIPVFERPKTVYAFSRHGQCDRLVYILSFVLACDSHFAVVKILMTEVFLVLLPVYDTFAVLSTSINELNCYIFTTSRYFLS